MLWRLLLAACLFAIGLGIVAGHAQFGPGAYVGAAVGGGGGTPPALDGSATSESLVSNTASPITLSTAQSDDIIVLCISYGDGGGGTTITGVSSANTTSWARRGSRFTGSVGGNYTEMWIGKAAAALASETISIAFSPAYSYTDNSAFGVSGANTTAISDANGALPVTGTTAAVALTTSHAADFLFACYTRDTTLPTAGAGWTQIVSANSTFSEYKQVTATQSGVSAAIASGDLQMGIGDAIVSP